MNLLNKLKKANFVKVVNIVKLARVLMGELTIEK